ncbi:MAG: hypothetical protein BIFFINMI_02096 [Phycisphaerae bacterium]|nr:hypothetical protein [Phycisphaerae bacterium]
MNSLGMMLFSGLVGMMALTGAGCQGPTGRGKPPTAREDMVASLEEFRLDHQHPPRSYREIKSAKEDLEQLGVFLGERDPKAFAQAIWEVLGRGDVLTYADYLILWKLCPWQMEYAPESQEAVMGMCAKIDNRGRSELPREPLEEGCAMIVETLSRHIHVAAPAVLENTEVHWDRWPAWKAAVSNWTPEKATQATSEPDSGQ